MAPQASDVFIGVLSGGAGTRLWPVSRRSYPKQFYNLASDEPLIIETLKRVDTVGKLHVLTTELLKFSSLGILNRYRVKADIIAEPSPQNTAPIISVFNEYCFQQNKNAVVCIFPADHSIQDIEKFRSDLNLAIDEAAKGNIVTIGIPPRTPATGFGYIEVQGGKGALEVKRFVEKPVVEKAKQLIAEGAMWNSGIFVFSAATFRNELKLHATNISNEVEKLTGDLSNLAEVYRNLPSISIDYALIEKVKGLKCIRATFDWSDLGSWEEVSAKSSPHEITEVSAKGNFYRDSNKIKKTVAFVGVDDIMVIDTPDALLVVKKGHGQEVKNVVEKLKESSSKVSEEHAFEDRPWGRFDVLLDNPLFKSKLITVWPGQRLSYQSHNHRREHWIIVEGEGEFTLDDKARSVKAGDYLFIPQGSKHRISNNGKSKLEFVEVQQGTYFGEDDIVRYEDDYGRK